MEVDSVMMGHLESLRRGLGPDPSPRALELLRESCERIAHFGPAEGDAELLIPPKGCELELRNLRANQRTALQALTRGAQFDQAAQEAGVDRRTLYRWLHRDKAFAYALRRLRERTVDEVCDRLIQGASTAAATLGAHARHGNVRAATALLKLVMGMRNTLGLGSAVHVANPRREPRCSNKTINARRRSKVKIAKTSNVPSLARGRLVAHR